MKMKFYDTCSLLLAQEDAFKELFVVAAQTFAEIEHIKTSKHKDETVKMQARHLAQLLDENHGGYIVAQLPAGELTDQTLIEMFSVTPNTDAYICYAAYLYNAQSPIVFVTNDVACKMIAREIFHLPVTSYVTSGESEYTGYAEVRLDDEEMALLYNDPFSNRYELAVNQYLLIHNLDGELKDIRKWSGEELAPIRTSSFKSEMFGSVKAMAGDPYQQMLMDSLAANQITMVRGPAGTGKSYLSLAYLFSLMDKHKIDKIVVFCNTVATLNSAKLGYYPGTKDEKLLDSQIGNMLSSKLGGKNGALERLVAEDKIVLMPMSDIRGYDTSGMRAGIYITEAQNMDISLMKLALQRIGEDCVCIIDGDERTQVDDYHFSGSNNGMRRVSEVFRGEEIYGEVELQKIYRSRIAEIADRM